MKWELFLESMELFFDDIIVKKRILIKSGKLSIKRNSIYAVKSPNGIGKTLLFKNIFYSEKNSDIQMSFMDQNNDQVLSHVSILENIFMDEGNKQAIIDLGYGYLLNHDYRKLSGGERRLVSILRIFFSPSDLIILDEPTNDLDEKNVQLFIELIQKISKEKTFIIITHDSKVLEIASEIVTISDGNVVCTTCEKEKSEKSKRLIPNKRLVKKSFNKKVMSLSILSFLFVCMLSIMVYYFTSITEKKEKITDNQIDIFIPSSKYGNDIKDSSLPIAMVNVMYGDFSISEKIKKLKELKVDSESRGVTYNLNFNSNDKYEVYKLEYYDIERNNRFLTFPSIVENYYEKSSEQFCLNVGNIFSFEKNNTKEELDFNTDYYNLCINEFQENGYKLNYCTIVLNNIQFEDFLQSDEVQELMRGNYYIRSNETINLINQVDSYVVLKSIFVCFIIVLFFMIIVEAIFLISFMKIEGKKIVLFYNYGYDKKSLSKEIRKSIDDIIFRFTFCIVFSLANVYFMAKNGFENVFNYIFMIAFCLIVTITWIVNRIMIKTMIKRRMDWRYR